MRTQSDQQVPAPRPGVDNVFFALIPPTESCRQAIGIQTVSLPRLGIHPYLVSLDCLHVSLLDIGIKKNLVKRSFESTIAMAKESASQLRMAQFEVVFDQALSFGEKVALKPFVLRMGEGREQVADLCKKLKLCLARSGVHCDDKAATPHMTLARSPQALPAEAVGPVCWQADSLVLVHSVVGEKRHIHLQSWPLQGA